MKIKIKIGDFIVIAAIIIVSIGMLLFFKLNLNKTNAVNKYVSIQVDGKELERVKLDENIEGEKRVIKTKFGRNVLEFTKDSVRSIEADCPDQLDVLQGAISEPGQSIVCLPNRLVVEIIAEDKAPEIDVVN